LQMVESNNPRPSYEHGKFTRTLICYNVIFVFVGLIPILRLLTHYFLCFLSMSMTGKCRTPTTTAFGIITIGIGNYFIGN